MTQLRVDDGLIRRGEALVDQAYAVLRNAILSHQLVPGSRLSVPEIARRLDISRSPVREAIARLEHEGLAESISHRGAVVVDIGFEDLISIYDLREVLEGLAARLACRAADEQLLESLQENWNAHRSAVDDQDVARHMELDAEFHRLVRDASGNARLTENLRQLQGQVRVAMSTTVARRGGMQAALAEHRRLIEAIRGGDPVAAETRAREHIIRLRESLRDAAQAAQRSPDGREEP